MEGKSDLNQVSEISISNASSSELVTQKAKSVVDDASPTDTTHTNDSANEQNLDKRDLTTNDVTANDVTTNDVTKTQPSARVLTPEKHDVTSNDAISSDHEPSKTDEAESGKDGGKDDGKDGGKQKKDVGLGDGVVTDADALKKEVELNETELEVEKLLIEAATDKQLTDQKLEELLAKIGSNSEKINVQNIAKKLNGTHSKPLVALASGNGKLGFVKFLVENGFNIDLHNEDRMSGVMNASMNDHTPVALYLIEKGAMLNTLNMMGETVVHIAVKSKNDKLVEKCILTGANPNYQNTKGDTPLHIACQQNNLAIATMLLYLGAHMDYTNQIGESALHEACRNQMQQVVQIMCLQGCNVDFENRIGLTALHIAAKTGNVEIVRLLLLAGADIDRFNKDGLRAEDIALAHGHISVAEILSKLSASITTDKVLPLVRQLSPTKSYIKRLKLKVFGGGGVGKTSLIETLKTGYFWNFFRRPYGSTAGPMTQPEGTINSVLIPFDCYTRGIDIQNINLSGIGGLSVWEFSGYESYYSLYDFFVGDPSCIHAVVFRAKDDILVRRAQIFFWLNFIRARIAPSEPIGCYGAQLWAPHVLLIATHADSDCCSEDSRGRWRMAGWEELEKEIRQEFDQDLIIVPEVFVLDAHVADSDELKDLKETIGKMKAILTKYIGPELGFLEAVMTELPAWRRLLGDFPVVSWPSFIEYIRNKVNILATEEHIKELLAQLQIIGEVIYIFLLDKQDLVILDPKWLTTDLLGKLYSFEQLSVVSPDGRLSLEQIHRLQPKAELNDLRKIFNGLDMSTEVLVTTDPSSAFDSLLLFNFPALNTLVTPVPLWIDIYLPKEQKDQIWGGIRIGRREQMDFQLLYIFPRLLVAARRSLANRQDPVSNIREWSTGIQFKVGEVACLISLTHDRLALDIVLCTVKAFREKAFEVCEYFSSCVVTALEVACPGLFLTRMPLSPYDLKSNNFQKESRSYSVKYLLTAQLKNEVKVELEGKIFENFKDIFAFGSKKIFKNIKLGADLHISSLRIFVRSRLAGILDRPHPEGKDWKLLAKYLNIDDTKLNLDGLPTTDTQAQAAQQGPQENKGVVKQPDQVQPVQPHTSPTDALIAAWSYMPDSNVRKLADTFLLMGRVDAYDVLISGTTAYMFVPTEPHTDDDNISDSEEDSSPGDDVGITDVSKADTADDAAAAVGDVSAATAVSEAVDEETTNTNESTA